ncbi:ATP-dependent acyl-CoA ligase [bacterium]|nr:MAG: ATP-dependent acyl-CoA ligase [bacterium]
MALTLPALLQETARHHAGHVFLICDDLQLTYAQTLDLVQRATTYLRDEGVGRDSHVALMLRNHPAFLIVWFALSSLGSVVVPINTDMKGKTLRHIIEQSDVQMVITEARYSQQIGDALQEWPGAPKVVQRNTAAEYLSALAQTSPDLCGTDFSDTLPMMITYTSGTTNMPKGVVLSHRSYVAAGRDMAAVLQLTSHDRYYLFLPLFHVNPQMYAVMAALHAGSSIAIDERFSARNFWRRVVETGATVFTYVGTVLSILARGERPRSLGALRLCVGGGATVSVWETLNSWGIDVREIYGMTELGGFTTANTAEACKLGSVGRPRVCQDVDIRDADDRSQPDGVPGEIVVRANVEHVVFDGYYKRPDLTAERLRGGWFHTDDMGHRDAEGYYYFVDRSKDMIRKKGENISPTHLEELLSECPYVKEVSVVGVPSDIGEEDIKAVVVPRSSITPSDLHEWCLAHVPQFMVPRYYELRTSLPKTATSKTSRRELMSIAETWDCEA